MKVIHLVAYYPPHLGGMELCAKELAERTSKKGYEIKVFTSNVDEPLVKEKPKIFALNAIEFAHVPFMPSLLPKVLNEIDSDTVLHTHTGVAFVPEITYIASKIKKVPYVVHIHGDIKPSGFFGFIQPFYINHILKFVLKKADKIIFLTNDYKKYFCDKYGISVEKSVVIPNGIMKSGNNKFRKDIKNKKIRLLSVGRLAKQKNVFRLIESIAILNKKYDLELNIIGDGEDKQKIIDLIDELGLKNVVNIRGRVSDEELIDYYSSNDIYIMSSDYEALPLTLLEVMASGLPIVSTDIRGVNEILKDCAVLTKLNSKALAKGIETLVDDDIKRSELSKKGKQESKKYDWDVIVDKIIEIYKDLNVKK